MAERLATSNDLATWTMPSTSKMSGLGALADVLAQGMCEALNAEFGISAQVHDVSLPARLFESRIVASVEEFDISLKSVDDECTLNIVINTRDWNVLVCEFFGGSYEHVKSSDDLSPIEQVLRETFAERIVRTLTVVMGSYGHAALSRSIQQECEAPNDVLSIDVSILTSPQQKFQCRMNLSAPLVRSIWDSLCGNLDDLANECVACHYVAIELIGQMPVDGIPMEQILNHSNGEVMIVGDAAKQKVRLICNDIVVCEGILTERNGRYAIEVTTIG